LSLYYTDSARHTALQYVIVLLNEFHLLTSFTRNKRILKPTNR